MNAGIAWKAVLGLLLLAVAGCAHDRGLPVATSEYTTIMPRLPERSAQAAPAPATQTADREITRFADDNKDGKVTRDEAKADPALARSFDKYDLDKNGILDRGEFARLEADARDEQAQSKNEADQHEFRGHPRRGRAEGESLNRTGERGP